MGMRDFVKHTIRSMSPALFTAIQRRRHPYMALAHRAMKPFGLTVAGGPFVGMKCIDLSAERPLLPSMLGTYEEEIAPVVEEMIGVGLTRVINVGAGVGYYAVGFARAIREAEIIAFDSDAGNRDRCMQLATLNGVNDRVHMKGSCDPHELCAVPADDTTLVMCDVEGYENELFEDSVVDHLRRSYLIIELHDVYRPGTEASLLKRFSATHVPEVIASRKRDPGQYPHLRHLTDAELRTALNEHRDDDDQHWMILRPALRGASAHASTTASAGYESR